MNESPDFIDCIPIRDLTRYFLDELDENRREVIERHLDGCEFCTALSERVADKIQAEWEAELGLKPEIEADPLIEEEPALSVADKMEAALDSVAGAWKGIVGISKGALRDAAGTMREHLTPEHWDFLPASARGGAPPKPDAPVTVLVAFTPDRAMVRISLAGSLLTVNILGYPKGAELPVLALVSGDRSAPLFLPARVVREGDQTAGRELTAEARLPSESAEYLIILK